MRCPGGRDARSGPGPVRARSILVTGGAGYIGSHTSRLLHELGHHVVVLDRADATAGSAVAPIAAVRGDVGDARLVASVLAEHEVDAVVHLAGDKSIETSLADPGAYFANNVVGTLTLLRAMVDAGVARLVFSSTCAVYGPDAEPPFTESSHVDPQTPYGESKLIVERILHWFDQAHRLRSVSLRYFNAAGAASDAMLGEDWTTGVNLVPMVMKAAAGLLPLLTVNGRDYPTPDGTAVRDYVHVEDLARAHAAALDFLEAGGSSEILNLGTGRGASILEVVAAAERASGQVVPIAFGPRRPGDLAAVWADSTRARERLGWRAELDLDAIVGTAWRWHARGVAATATADE
jgi:UDP-glucose-4-epimerase GalE